MDTLRLEVRRRTLLLDAREFVFVAEDGREVERTDTAGVVRRAERFVNRRLRGPARPHGRAQLLQALRQFNCPKEGYAQFVAVDAASCGRLEGLSGPARERALDEAVVRAVQARLPVDLLAIERWARDRGLWIGLSGKNQALSGRVRLASEGITSHFPPEKLLARSLLDKPEAFRGPMLRILVVDDPFVDAVTGDGAFLVRASAPRDCERIVRQRVRRCLDPVIRDARRGEVYMRLEFEDKVARHDTEILSVTEDGDLLHVEKRERARIDTGAKLVHEEGFKGTAIVVDELPAHIEAEWPRLDGVCNASCIKSNALLSAHASEGLWGGFQRAFLLRLDVRMLFTGRERFSCEGNRVSLNVLSTLHSVSPAAMDRLIEARCDETPAPVIRALLWWADRLADGAAGSGLPALSKAALREAWGEGFERRFAFGDLADHPILDPARNAQGFVALGRGGNRLLVPSARVLLSTLGQVEVEGEPGYHFPDFVNGILQAVRSLDVRPERFERAREQLRGNVLRAANAMLDRHSIRVPGIHAVLVAVEGLGRRVVVPDRVAPFAGTVHGEPTMNRDGIRAAEVEPLRLARARGAPSPAAAWLLDRLSPGDFEVALADFDRLTRMNRDNDGDLVYLSRARAAEGELDALDAAAEVAPAFVDPRERLAAVAEAFRDLRAHHDPVDLPAPAVHRAVLETAGSARDVGSITLWKYVAQEALAEAGAWDLVAAVARIVQAYIDGLKGPHQQSANLFAALMRCWARMAVPCLAVREGGQVVAVRLSPPLLRELLRAGYEEGRDFRARVEVPHPGLAEEAYRRVRAPLGAILQDILGNLIAQGLATLPELLRLRGALERAYGAYPDGDLEGRAGVVEGRRARYRGVQTLYGIRPVQGLADLASVEVSPLWKRLMDLSARADAAPDVLDERAARVLAHGRRPAEVAI